MVLENLAEGNVSQYNLCGRDCRLILLCMICYVVCNSFFYPLLSTYLLTHFLYCSHPEKVVVRMMMILVMTMELTGLMFRLKSYDDTDIYFMQFIIQFLRDSLLYLFGFIWDVISHNNIYFVVLSVNFLIRRFWDLVICCLSFDIPELFFYVFRFATDINVWWRRLTYIYFFDLLKKKIYECRAFFPDKDSVSGTWRHRYVKGSFLKKNKFLWKRDNDEAEY
jgi:hypothetical protein